MTETYGGATPELIQELQVIARKTQRRNTTMENETNTLISETIFTRIKDNNAELTLAVTSLRDLADRLFGVDPPSEPCENLECSDSPLSPGTLHYIHEELTVSGKRLNALNECIRRLKVL